MLDYLLLMSIPLGAGVLITTLTINELSRAAGKERRKEKRKHGTRNLSRC